MTIYPTYYQKGPVCIKRESDTHGKQVIIPEASHINSYGFQFLTTSDKSGFDSLVSNMNVVTLEVYERYLIMLHQFTQKQHLEFRESHELTPEFPGSSDRRIPG